MLVPRPRPSLAFAARPRLLVTSVVLTLAAAAGSPAQSPVRGTRPAAATRASAGAAAEVERTLRAVFAAAERNDLAALDTLYAGDSLTVVEGAGISRGWRDYRDRHLAPELREMRGMRYRPADVEVRVAGNVAWAVFRYGLKATTGARAVDVVGRGTAVLERQGEGSRWMVRHTQTSSRPRRPADPPLS